MTITPASVASVRRRFRAGFAVAAAVVAATVVLAAASAARLVRLEAEAEAANAALIAVERLLSTVKDAETGQRGYLLTAEPRFLEPYEAARERFAAELERLSPHPEIGAGIERAARAKLEELEVTVRLAREGAVDSALARVRRGEGKRRMDALRGEVAAFSARQLATIEDRERARAAQSVRTRAAFGVAAVVLLALLAGLYVLTSRYVEERERAAGRAAELRRELEARVDELTEVNADLDGFAYTVSHDLRAPLRAMHGFAEALLEDYGSVFDETARLYASRIVGAAERMDRLVQDLLAYNRLTRRELVAERVSARDAVADALAAERADLESARASVTVDPALDALVLRANRVATVQVLRNLVANAATFVRPDATPVISIGAERRGTAARLYVRDDGIGVAPEHRERIFRVFERLHGSESYPGTGVGLAIVRRGAQRMGGTAGVEAGEEGGSVFWVELPADGSAADRRDG